MAKKKTRTTAAKKKAGAKRSTGRTTAATTAKKKTTPGRGAKKATTKQTAPAKPDTQVELKITHDQIAQRAYEIWLAKGRPHGLEQQNWYEAKADLIRRMSR